MFPLELERIIEESKQKYSSVFTFSFDKRGDDLVILARPLSIYETEHLFGVADRNSDIAAELIFDNCLIAVWSNKLNKIIDKENVPTGLTLDLQEIVMKVSDMSNPYALINDITGYRNIAGSAMMGGAAFIMGSFPQYTLADIKQLNRTQFAELIVLAELASKQPFEIKTPEELEKEAKKGSNSNLIRKIKEEARTNDRYLNFAEENAEIRANM